MLLSNSFAGEAGLAANFTRHGGDPDRRTSAADASAVRRSAAAGAQRPLYCRRQYRRPGRRSWDHPRLVVSSGHGVEFCALHAMNCRGRDADFLPDMLDEQQRVNSRCEDIRKVVITAKATPPLQIGRSILVAELSKKAVLCSTNVGTERRSILSRTNRASAPRKYASPSFSWSGSRCTIEVAIF
jgi:hypothetical protein